MRREGDQALDENSGVTLAAPSRLATLALPLTTKRVASELVLALELTALCRLTHSWMTHELVPPSRRLVAKE